MPIAGAEIDNTRCPHCGKIATLVWNPVCELYECDICRYRHR